MQARLRQRARAARVVERLERVHGVGSQEVGAREGDAIGRAGPISKVGQAIRSTCAQNKGEAQQRDSEAKHEHQESEERMCPTCIVATPPLQLVPRRRVRLVPLRTLLLDKSIFLLLFRRVRLEGLVLERRVVCVVVQNLLDVVQHFVGGMS